MELEHVVHTVHLHKYVNLSIFTIGLVDAMNVHQNLIDDEDDFDESPHHWFKHLAIEMVGNTLDSKPSPRRNQTKEEAAITPQSPSILVLGTTNEKK